MKTIVCIFAHPDDEAFGPGGTIAKFASKNNVYVICVTNGAAGKNSGKDLRHLAEVRREELLESSEILGVKEVIFLDYEDGMLSNNMYHDIATTIQEKLEKLKPEIVITLEPRGVSGHIDHITVSLVTTFVFYKLSFVKTLMYYCLTQEYRNANKKLLDQYFIYFPPGYKKEDIDEVVDTSEVWEKKKRAMFCHKSQLHDVKRILSMQEKRAKREYFMLIEK